MLLTIFIIGAILAGVCRHIYQKSDEQEVYLIAEAWMWVGIAAMTLSLVLSLCLSIPFSSSFTIDEKIAMYQEENTKIEEQIAIVVEQYQQYETDIFKSVTPESTVILVTLYPELKSDTLVQKQIEVYLANNEKIKTLREDKINAKIYKWWLYFGS